MSSFFEFLFKFRPTVFEQGSLELLASPWMVALALVAGIGLSLAALRYWRPQGRTRPFERALLAALRLGAIALLVLCLLQPALVVRTAVPQESFVALLVDDSQSMLSTGEGTSRADQLLATLGDAEGGLIAGLRERFRVRLLGFDRGVRRLQGTDELQFRGTDTQLGEALLGAQQEMAGLPVTGIVLLSDGADRHPTELTDALLELQSSRINVSTVGFGAAGYRTDIEVGRVAAPRSVLKGSTVAVDVTLRQTGFAGRSVPLEVVDEGRIVSVSDVRFPVGASNVTASVQFVAEEAGPRRFSFRVPIQPGEAIEANNTRGAVVEILERRERVLYIEGEPRWEFKFLRRAIQDDEQLQVVSMARTAENKFYGLDFDDDTKRFEGGFPTRREDLFEFAGVIVGSIEASFFTYDQMKMLVDFASMRGGGVLLLGGRRSFSEGGFVGTPLEDLMPVELGPAAGGEGEPFFALLDVELTPAGRNHPVTLIGEDRETSNERFGTLPQLSTFNPLTRLKAGATALLVGRGELIEGEQIVLAHHRMGRGRAIAFTPHDSWHWQMHADIEVEDLSHERFWRQLLRWLVSYVPDQVEVRTDRDRVEVGSPVALEASVRDEGFVELNGANVVATVRSPSAERIDVPLEWTIEEDGEYRASYVPQEEGVHEIEMIVRAEGEVVSTSTASFEVAQLNDELYQSERRDDVLTRISEETGGRSYEASEWRQLAEDLSLSSKTATVREVRELWDMPALFLAMMLLLCAEWSYRRLRGLQ